MTWFWLAGAAIAGIVAGYLAGWRAVITAMRPALQQLNRNLANDRNLALGLLRRELANWMFRHDPDRYLQTYKKAHEAAKAISTTEGSEQRAELADLTEHYKCYRDFDLLGTREYVLYADALSTNTYDEVERHYTDIVRFQALQIAVDDNWSDIHHPTSEAELAHLEKYVQRFKDTRFKNRLKDPQVPQPETLRLAFRRSRRRTMVSLPPSPPYVLSSHQAVPRAWGPLPLRSSEPVCPTSVKQFTVPKKNLPV